MTNDTSTLNGALQELGETMASNLVAMGVSDAQASDGLTTLAGKILDIPVSPVTKLLTVTSDKDILSYYDSESATLTATYTENGSPVSGKTVTFKAYKNGTLVENIGSDTTDANGEASVSYSSKGSGDLNIQCECNLVTETYAIEDCIATRITEWSYTQSGSGHKLNNIIDNSFDLPSHFVLDFDYKGSGTARTGLYNSGSSENYNIDVQVSSNDYVGVHRSTSVTGMDSGRLTADNTQYHNCKITVNGTTVTWLLGGTNSSSATVSWISSKPLHYIVAETWANGSSAYVKNLKLKAL